ncbi:MAG: hypothetical protein QOE48_2866 [Mycobacterium sp.]|nr:hypothetical protein [Mycobacterium sp.]MDT5051809.1 hypothetical protein [Mycobacterium sp.]MDT5307188.1 hypothetical protein [Mycobacterium sp.]
MRSTLTSVLVGPESLGSAMADAGWSTRDLGTASNDPSARKGFAEGLTAHEDGYEAMFFVHARHHHGLVAPTVELTPSFVWWLELIPSGDGQWIRLDSAGRRHRHRNPVRPRYKTFRRRRSGSAPHRLIITVGD